MLDTLTDRERALLTSLRSAVRCHSSHQMYDKWDVRAAEVALAAYAAPEPVRCTECDDSGWRDCPICGAPGPGTICDGPTPCFCAKGREVEKHAAPEPEPERCPTCGHAEKPVCYDSCCKGGTWCFDPFHDAKGGA